MSMNPRETTEKIRGDYQDYIASILEVKDAEITKLAREKVLETDFIKGPYLETTLPFEEGKSLKELAEEGLVSSEFEKMGASVHYEDWKLRIHQETALRHIIEEDRNMVVSTGTGSGKTECYLYPIFNALMREKEAGTLNPGVRAILIFPMNALANDQQKKLRKLLKNYPDITFGRYTGETKHKLTKESADEAEQRMHREYDEAHITDSEEVYRNSIPNELMCREKMAETPPHILLTNYAMLEYMLLRPDTAPFFDNSFAKHWRFIVIDEAHTYKGASGTEIAYLLRRVKERIRHHMTEDFRCIATSATLGSEDGKAGLAAFASNLFDESFSPEDIITTKRVNRKKEEGARLFTPDEYKELKKQTEGMDENEKGIILFDSLRNDLRLFRVYEALKSKPKRIEDVASVVFDDYSEREAEVALIDLIELAAAAKKSLFESALLPARYHLFVKSLEGMFVQYYPQKMVYLDRKEKVGFNGMAYSVFELANCQKCEQEYLVGKTIEIGNNKHFVQTSSMDKPEFYFISNGEDEGELTGLDEDDSLEGTSKVQNLEKFHLCLCCGRITPFAEKHTEDCCKDNSPQKMVTVYYLKYKGKNNESNYCPCCGATKKGLIKRFLTANQPATFAVAKSLYDTIPPRPISNTKPNGFENGIKGDDLFGDDLFGDDLFGDEPAGKGEETTLAASLTDESGRKLLIFSDNRQEAAFFAGFFEKKYNLIMWRKIILKCLHDAKDGSLNVADLINKVWNEADRAGLYTFDQERKANLTDNQKQELATLYVMQEFINPDIQNCLEGLGYIQILPEEQKLNESVEISGLKGEDLWNLLTFMMDTLRQKGANNYPECIRATNDFFAPKNHAGYFRQAVTTSEREGHFYGFIPEEGRVNKRLAFMQKLLTDVDADKETKDKLARENLNKVYQLLLRLKGRNYILDSASSSQGTVYQLNYAKWNFHYVKDTDNLYLCKKCGKVFGYSIKGYCPEMKCDGRLERVSAGTIKSEPYYKNLFSDSKIIPMVSREHTAQLSSKTAGEYQKDFEEGKINVLSCSTTFEMGVDVGELEATFLRNVPPETSNYIQRAGRAGRRTSSAAFSVTFSRRNSHDITFFHDPAQIIAGKISPPVLEIDNEKIAERHLNSIVISWFFKQKSEYFYQNTRKIVSYGESENMASELRELLSAHPEDLLKSIHDVIPEDICESLGVDSWEYIQDLTGDEGALTKAIAERLADIKGLKQYAAELQQNLEEDKRVKKYSRVIAAEKLIATLESEPSINFLSAKGVLPKYGFPIDSVSLDILGGSEEEAKKIDLSRDLKMAISEFAPPAKIVANGKIWESYAINTVPDKGWPAYIYYTCPECARIYHSNGHMVDVETKLEDAPKLNCDYDGTLLNPKLFIVPIFGFSTQFEYKPKLVGDSRPSTYYSTQTQFWGTEGLTEKQKAEAKDQIISFKGENVKVTYSPGGKLFVLNQGVGGRGLHICPNCGFAKDPLTMLKGNRHETKYKRTCSCKSFVKASLGQIFSTDILKITLPVHSVVIKNNEAMESKDQYLSILYAILEGASKALDINRDDINGCVTEKMELVLFDDTAGGSGYVKQIYENFEKVLREARNKVSGICGCTPETSCYGCLRNYSNQFYHDQISRGIALSYIDWLLNTDREEKKEKNNTDNKKQEEKRGIKTFEYEAPDSSTYPDSATQLIALENDAEDESLKAGYRKLAETAQKGKYENPVSEEKLPAKEKDIWPELFWGKSKVALFTSETKKQYEILKKYDWYCYIVDENIDAELVFSHIEKEE